MTHRSPLGAAAAALLLTLPSLHISAAPDDTESPAEPDLPRVEETLIVSSSLIERPEGLVGSSVTVIDREEIERRGKDTVLELLRSVPGLEVAQTGGPGKTTSVFIRGGNSNHTLVVIDGVRVNGNTTGAFDFANLTPDNLERIEVLRGPQGVLYGSEAVTGVISIRTRTGEGELQGYASGAVGSAEYSRFAAGVSGASSSGAVRYSVAASRVATDGVSAASEEAGNTEDDPWTNLAISGQLETPFWGDGTLSLAVRHTEGDTDIDGFTFGVGPSDDLNAEQERENTVATLRLEKKITEGWTQTLVVARSDDRLTGIDPDNPFGNFNIEGVNTTARTQADLTVHERGLLSIGYQVEKREAENVGSFDESLYLRSAFAETLWSLGERSSVSVGVRYDDHSVFGDETTYRVAASLGMARGFRFHGSLGTGFKAPTFNDLYFPGFGNLDLRPETSRGFDAGFEWRAAQDDWTIDLTYFDNEIEDLILFTFPAGFVNVAEAETSGFELSLAWQPSESFELRASHTLTETEDLATGLQLARRPENRTTLDVFFEPAPRLRATASLIAISDRIDSDGSEMDDYERVDLSVDYRLNERFRPFARIENLFDQDFAEIPGFTSPGATFVVGLNFSG
ncbi:MAG: TonB-dependent receptor [Acidobacteriota bacterium]